MTDLIDFLRARTEEDRQAALACHPNFFHGNWEARNVGGPKMPSVWDGTAQIATNLADEHATLIARGSPNRVLAEVEAKRGVIDAAEAARDQYEHDGVRDPELRLVAETWESALRVLGTAYAVHPDYREGWRPGSTPAWVVDR